MNSVDRSTSDRCDPELIGQYLGIAEDEPRAVESFDDFYRREYRSVVGLAFALGGSAAASEELAQDAFAAAFRNWGRISGYDRPEQWVRRVLVNNCRSRGRRLAAELRAMTRLRGRRERLPELTEPDHEFWAAVRALPERQSQSVALHYLEDRPVDEIAEILGCTTGTVKQHLHRGRRALAATLGLAGPDGPGGPAVGGPVEETGAGPVSGTAPADGNDGANGSAG